MYQCYDCFGEFVNIVILVLCKEKFFLPVKSSVYYFGAAHLIDIYCR